MSAAQPLGRDVVSSKVFQLLMHSENRPLVSTAAVRMAFGGVDVLKGVEIELWPGEVHGITGENGAGKSTLAKIIAGVHRPTGGQLIVNGDEAWFRSPREAAAAGVALIHQEPLVFPHLSVAENIFVARHRRRAIGGIDWSQTYKEAAGLLADLGVRLDPRAKVEGLSIANQQMVELAAALSQDAKVLILDETTASLTPEEVNTLFKIMGQLRDQGCAIAIVSHRLEEVFEICDRITVLRDGEKVGEVRPSESSIEDVVRLMVGRSMAPPLAASRPPRTETVLEVNGLSSLGRFRDVSFSVGAGEIVALAGLVGSGRTEVAESIFGLGQVDTGSIHIEGNQVKLGSPRQALAMGVALVPEDRQHHGLLMPMSIVDNATLTILSRLSRLWASRKESRRVTTPYAERLRLAFRDLAQPVRELSGGNQQKVVLAKWLLTKPRLLIVDEPTRGVDIAAKAEVHRLLQELAAEGVAILMVSSDLPEVLQMADRIYVMREGQIDSEISRSEANAEKVMQAAAGQRAHAI